MVVDVAVLAATVVGKILLPYVKKGAAAVADELTDSMGKAAAEGGAKTAATIWSRVKEALSRSGKGGAVEQFEQYPDEAKALLERALADHLATHPDFARELDALVHNEIAAGRDVVQLFGDGVAYVGGDVSGGIVAGKIGSLVEDKTVPPPAK